MALWGKTVRVAVNVLEARIGPQSYFYASHVVAMLLQPGCLQIGRGGFEMRTLEFCRGQIMLFPKKEKLWVRTLCDAVQWLEITISDAVLSSACDGVSGDMEPCGLNQLADPRVRALVDAVNAERIAGFPGGKLFLDSVERALAAVLVDSYAIPRPSVQTHRGGLGPARLRRVKELVYSKLENQLTLQEMAQAVELSVAHFSQMFRRSTGQSPHQFVLCHRIDRAKEMLRANRVRALDIAIACGFKTQQHFSRVFRQISGVTPREYRHEFRHHEPLQSR